jgi:hypothetical protein
MSDEDCNSGGAVVGAGSVETGGTGSGVETGGVTGFGVDFFGLVFLVLGLAFLLVRRLAFFFTPFLVFRLTNSCTELQSKYYR